jgi:hydroxyethylthiazole kinase-like uncharacterized protein yjeF
VLDADALNAIAADEALATLLRQRSAPTVLTPHPLEAARLLACSASDVQAERLKAANDLALRFGCVVVLKGSGSVIAAPGHVPVINATGNALLATAGTGDVLAGWIGGLWARMAGLGLSDSASLKAARAAVYLHGRSADEARKRNSSSPMRATDLINVMWAAA